MSYFLITSGEDGMDSHGPLTKNQLFDKLEERNYSFQSDLKMMDNQLVGKPNKAGDDLAVIIKGEVITPSPVQVVTRYNID